MKDRVARKSICRLGRHLVERGLVHGTAGNISVRTDRGYLLTPTGCALDALDPDDLSLVSADGEHVSGLAPTKEHHLHRAMYEARPSARAIVHTHSTHCVAVTLLPHIHHDDALPALTPYYIMRVGYAPVVPYFPPGDPELAATVGRYATGRNVLLLAHHGPVVAGASLDDAAMILEELEENARLFLLVAHDRYRTLDAGAVKDLRERFPTENS
jgi:ribulose-5-phosphate 4-epimerase/fuculose-1-phosphate aldolase